MTWREKTVIRILLMVARIVNEDSKLNEELVRLNQYIDCWAPKPQELHEIVVPQVVNAGEPLKTRRVEM